MEAYLGLLKDVCERLGVDPLTTLKGVLLAMLAASGWTGGRIAWRAGRALARLSLAGCKWAVTPRPPSEECQAALLALDGAASLSATGLSAGRLFLALDGKDRLSRLLAGGESVLHLLSAREKKAVARKAAAVLARLEAARDEQARARMIDVLTGPKETPKAIEIVATAPSIAWFGKPASVGGTLTSNEAGKTPPPPPPKGGAGGLFG